VSGLACVVGGSLTWCLVAIVDGLVPRFFVALLGCRLELAELPSSLECADVVGAPRAGGPEMQSG